MKKINDFLSIGDAAKFLGVTTNTLKNWEIAKKLVPYRNPTNGYRLYVKEDLEKLLEEISSSETYRSEKENLQNENLALIANLSSLDDQLNSLEKENDKLLKKVKNLKKNARLEINKQVACKVEEYKAILNKEENAHLQTRAALAYYLNHFSNCFCTCHASPLNR